MAPPVGHLNVSPAAMPPKNTDRKHLPPSCKALKDALGTNVSAEGIASADAKLRNRAFGALRAQLTPAKARELKELQNDSERRRFLAEYLLDPESCNNVGENVTERSTLKRDRGVEKWLTFSQLCGPLGFNSKEDAEAALPDLEEQDHELPSLAAKGVKQYLYTDKAKITHKDHKKSASVTAKAQLSAEQYAAVQEHMEEERNPGLVEPKSNRSSSSKKRKLGGEAQNPPPGPNKTPEQIARELVVTKTKKALQDMKRQYDKVNSDLTDVKKVQAKLRAKSWNTEGPLKYLEETSAAVSTSNETLMSQWLAGCAHKLEDLDDQGLEDLAKQFADHTEEMKSTWKTFAKEVLGEFSKLG